MNLKLDFHDVAWWYWLTSWCLIVAGLAGWPIGFLLVVILSAVQIVHYLILEKSVTAFSVQVRIVFLLLVLVGLWAPLQFIYWLPAVGLVARVLVNYCPLARVMSLMPWNRLEALSLSLLRRTFLTGPVEGSILEHR